MRRQRHLDVVAAGFQRLADLTGMPAEVAVEVGGTAPQHRIDTGRVGGKAGPDLTRPGFERGVEFVDAMPDVGCVRT